GIFGECVENQRVGDFGDHVDRLEAAGLNLVDGFADLRTRFDEFFTAVGVDDRGGGVVAGLKLAGLDGFDRIKFLDDLLGRAVLGVKSAKERRRRDLAALVDADGQGVFLGDGAFDPASTFGDDAAAVQRAVAFLDFDEEVDAGRAVKL